MKTLLEVLQSGTDYLSGKGTDSPRLMMEQLMARVLECPRLQLYLRFESPIPEDRLVRLREGIRRLGAGEPLQYVLGDTEFMGHRFKADRRALIPRPDTETLVNAVLACEPLARLANPAITEVGVGSGCVIISLALARPVARYVAIDASSAALELARENAALHGRGEAIRFVQGNLLEGVAPGSLDAVVANLPYIPTADCEKLPRHIREHEPLTALDGGGDGLVLIRQLASQAARGITPGGRVFLEIGFDQGSQVVELLRRNGFIETVILKDLGERDRVVMAVRQGDIHELS